MHLTTIHRLPNHRRRRPVSRVTTVGQVHRVGVIHRQQTITVLVQQEPSGNVAFAKKKVTQDSNVNEDQIHYVRD